MDFAFDIVVDICRVSVCVGACVCHMCRWHLLDALPMEAFAAHAVHLLLLLCITCRRLVWRPCMRVCRHMMLHKARAKLATFPVAHTHRHTHTDRERKRDAAACGCISWPVAGFVFVIDIAEPSRPRPRPPRSPLLSVSAFTCHLPLASLCLIYALHPVVARQSSLLWCVNPIATQAAFPSSASTLSLSSSLSSSSSHRGSLCVASRARCAVSASSFYGYSPFCLVFGSSAWRQSDCLPIIIIIMMVTTTTQPQRQRHLHNVYAALPWSKLICRGRNVFTFAAILQHVARRRN